MTALVPAPEARRSWPILRPVVAVLAAASMAYPLGGKGLITAFLGFGILGIAGAWRQPVLRRVSIAALVWSGATLWSAKEHGDKLVTQLGLYGIVVTLAVAGLWWLHDVVGLRRETVLLLGAAGWLGLNYHQDLVLSSTDNAWKFVLVGPVSVLVLALAWRIRAPRLLLVAILAGLTTLSLLHDSRFPAGLSAVVAVATLLHKRGIVTRASIVRQLLVFAAAVVATLLLYPPLATHGYFGHRAQQQQRQITAQRVNFLFDNRPELVQAAWIAAHHPYLGIGPGSSLTSEESNETLQYLVGLGLPMDINRQRYLEGDTLSQGYAAKGYSQHSSALDAVAQGGLLAAPFWIFYAFILVRMILTRAREPVTAVPAIVWLSLFALWDALFSPLEPTQWPELALAIFLASTPSPILAKAPAGDDAEATPPSEETAPTQALLPGRA